jgi:hypothetical protein
MTGGSSRLRRVLSIVDPEEARNDRITPADARRQ